ncbi:MAG: thioredoxin family protein [Chitinophagaceae bacterium]|nr:thioredoxin family protein [Chitinophagaceae bacterium]
MKRLLFSLMLLPALSFSVQAPDNLEIGASLPKAEVKMKDVSGKDVSFNDIKTKQGLLVMFSCNTCPYVVRNQTRTKEILAYAQSKGVGVVVLNSNEGSRDDGDGFADMQAYAKEQGYKWNYVVDRNNEIADAFGANRTPECFLFDSNNKLVYHGAIDDNPSNEQNVERQHLKEAVNETLAGKPVSTKTTRSVGCNIKRG